MRTPIGTYVTVRASARHSPLIRTCTGTHTPSTSAVTPAAPSKPISVSVPTPVRKTAPDSPVGPTNVSVPSPESPNTPTCTGTPATVKVPEPDNVRVPTARGVAPNDSDPDPDNASPADIPGFAANDTEPLPDRVSAPAVRGVAVELRVPLPVRLSAPAWSSPATLIWATCRTMSDATGYAVSHTSKMNAPKASLVVVLLGPPYLMPVAATMTSTA